MKIVVFPIAFVRAEDKLIANRESFFDSYENLWPDFNLFDQNKQVVLLSPYVNYYSAPIKN